jgi:hypothetical protein
LTSGGKMTVHASCTITYITILPLYIDI